MYEECLDAIDSSFSPNPMSDSTLLPNTAFLSALSSPTESLETAMKTKLQGAEYNYHSLTQDTAIPIPVHMSVPLDDEGSLSLLYKQEVSLLLAMVLAQGLITP